LKPTTRSFLSPQEILSISSEIGFSLEHPEVSAWEFDLAWLSESPRTQSLYFYPQTGFTGGAEAPAALWLRFADFESEKVSQPLKNRWDSLLAKDPGDGPQEADEKIRLAKSIALSPST